MSIHNISFDGYQSVEMAQAFRSAGIPTRLISLDRTPEPYNYLRDCLHEGRIAIVESERLHNELVQLEWDQRQNKVDHWPQGSKDIADAVCGAVWSAARSRELRHEGGFTGPDVQSVGPTWQRPQGYNRPPGFRRSPGRQRR